MECGHIRLTEEDYLAFKQADDDGKAKLLSTLIPIKDEKGQSLSIVKAVTLPISTVEKNITSYSENTDMKETTKEGVSRPYNERMAEALNKTLFKDSEHIKAEALSEGDVQAIRQTESKLIQEGKAQPSLEELRQNVKIALQGEAGCEW